VVLRSGNVGASAERDSRGSTANSYRASASSSAGALPDELAGAAERLEALLGG
jgi:hypothetical protein